MAETREDNLQLLFPTVVQVSQIPDHETVAAPLLAAVEEIRQREPSSKPQSWACDLYTTIGRPQELLSYPGLEAFWAIVDDKLRRYAANFNFDIERSPPRVWEAWINVYGAGHGQEIHLHKNSVISGIYYLKAPAGSGPTLFYSPHADNMLEPRATEGNAVNASASGFQPVEGRMLLFRSSLRHSVVPSQVDGERITIAFNAVM